MPTLLILRVLWDSPTQKRSTSTPCPASYLVVKLMHLFNHLLPQINSSRMSFFFATLHLRLGHSSAQHRIDVPFLRQMFFLYTPHPRLRRSTGQRQIGVRHSHQLILHNLHRNLRTATQVMPILTKVVALKTVISTGTSTTPSALSKSSRWRLRQICQW